MVQTRHPVILRFETFEVDLRAGELRKEGKRIRLQDQPLRVLMVLLHRPGEVVTREELRSQNWPADTFVDFDNSLNTAINKLREALGDSADNPRFIETLPRRGYRFLAPVRSAGGEERSSRPHVLTEKDTIVLGDFANSTGDPVFDGTLREGLSVELEQSPFLSLVSEQQIHQTLRMMEKPANARLTAEIAEEVCQRTSSAAALEGSIALIGTQYNLILKALSCASGDLLASTEARASDKSHVLDALGKAGSEMRGKLGESLTTLQKYNTPLEQATTPSLEALQAYSLGWKTADVDGDFAASLPFFQRAIQLDHNFAMAYFAISTSYGFVDESVRSRENSQKAFELRAGVTEPEKLTIEMAYYYYVNGNLTESRRSSELGARTYPRNPFF